MSDPIPPRPPLPPQQTPKPADAASPGSSADPRLVGSSEQPSRHDRAAQPVHPGPGPAQWHQQGSAYPPPQSYAGYPGAPAPTPYPQTTSGRQPYPPTPNPQASYPQQSYAQPSYAQPSYAQQAYAQPSYAQQAYAQPSYPQPSYAQPSPYAAPPGYAPATGSQPAYGGPLASPRRTGALGLVALVVGLVALLGSVVAVSIATFRIGAGTAGQLADGRISTDFDWSLLSPVRAWVLIGESAFWFGTVLGIWALVQGIVAIVKNRGRGLGIGAVICAALGPIAFAIAANVFLSTGFASGSGIGG
ncbi:hypothetical protein [Microbacterium sp. BK668]|uniref:hypothetical protein n=1 Tax=Microbacterium sp. BK668 TaxID=2512118 RepID=UPI0010DFB33E|nr:hypothetical protein [Microbacterium sp. BK668]TDN92380.1 hypothetical protein EV279_1900 [Microbacterium sp. BK668]